MHFHQLAKPLLMVLALGASLAQATHALAAEKACGGIAGLPCGKGMFCQEPFGTCGKGDVGGHCVRKPEFCPKIYLPVCGCDHHTYGNSCERERAGVSELHAGKC